MLLLTSTAYAAPYTVLAELMGDTDCNYCPNVQVVHEAMFDDEVNNYRIIPITFYQDIFPAGYTRRRNDYTCVAGAVPLSFFGGQNSTSGDALIPTFPDRYAALIDYESPFTLTPEVYVNDQGRVQVNVDVDIDQALLDGVNTEYLFMHTFLMSDTGPGSTIPHDPVALRFKALAYASQPITLPTGATELQLTQLLTLGNGWNYPTLRAVVVIQEMDPNPSAVTTNPPATSAKDITGRKIYQAAMVPFEDASTVLIASNLTSGPPDLHVNFFDSSYLIGDTVATWAWDFDGNGTIDATVQNPSWVYDTPGIYTVTLTVTTTSGNHIPPGVFADMIVVQSPRNVSGTIAGVWTSAHSPYVLAGNISVPTGFTLEIHEGVEVWVQPDVSITVNGGLQILGEKDNEVFFTSESTWGVSQGIRLLSYTGTTLIKHAVFEKCGVTPISSSRGLTVQNSVFRNNNGGSSAGALDLTSGTSTITGCYFANNVAGGTNATGGVSVSGGTTTISNSIFVNNTGTISGALRVVTNGTVNMTNCTLYRNQYNTTNPLGGVILNNNRTLNVTNSIIEGTVRILGTAPVNNVTYTRTMEFPSGIGNITADPLFVSPSSGNGATHATTPAGWRLQDASPCIDAGNPASEFNDVEDPNNAGTPLYAKGTLTNDMGAYGGQGFYANSPDTPTPPIPELVTITGKVVYGNENTPLPGATVTYTKRVTGSTPITVYSSDDPENLGKFTVEDLSIGAYDVTITGTDATTGINYEYTSPDATPVAVEVDILDFPNMPVTAIIYTVTGTVEFGIEHDPVAGALVTLTNANGTFEIATGNNGSFTLNPYSGSYTLTVTGTHYSETIEYTPTTFVVPYTDTDPWVIWVNQSSSDDDHVSVPTVTKLKSNYPNPFNPSTKIAFDIAHAGNVSIDVYNIKGQRVKTLVNGYYEIGNHSIIWNGDDSTGRSVGSGIYFYRMTTNGYNSVQKMLLMK